ncbi:MAG: YcaO-like family protein [Alphaproteobacteria bacterium]|nr:YcaO-like family protein [Alphaproteobacteria bacterium]
MFDDELPHIANLFCAAGSVPFRGVDISATGLGDTREAAIALRDAEFAERQSYVLGPTKRCMKPARDVRGIAPFDRTRPNDDEREIECLAARNLLSDDVDWFASDMISTYGVPAQIMAEGTAAGIDREMATLNAALEAIERYAARHWWLGLRTPAVPSVQERDHFDRLQSHWRRNQSRRTELLNITPAFGVPVFVAWSCQEDNRALCFGLSSHLNTRTAIRGALKELHQMEFGLEVIAYRRQSGVALAEQEKRILARACDLRVDVCQALLTPDRETDCLMDDADLRGSARLAHHLDRFGISIHAIDLPHADPKYQVVHAFSTDLRLPQASALAGGGSPGWTCWELY